MRSRRNLSGSLQLNQIKACFTLNDESRMPVGMCPFFSRPANKLIEEWMLAVNESAAKLLADHLPQEALLRRHPPPNRKAISEISFLLHSLGYKNCNLHSAASIQKFLCSLAGCPIELGWQLNENLLELCSLALDRFHLSDSSIANVDNKLNSTVTGSVFEESRILVLLNLLTRTMNTAEYFCLGNLKETTSNVASIQQTQHYALNMNKYTHFTSPIRRFADMIVHRQIACILANDAMMTGKQDLANWWRSTAYNSEQVNTFRLKLWAENCNVRRLEAREAYEESADLFYLLFVKNLGSTTELCSVVGVLDHSIDVLILSNGIKKRIYLNDLDLVTHEYTPCDLIDESKNVVVTTGKLILQWKKPDSFENQFKMHCSCYITEVCLFSIFRCVVSIKEKESSEDQVNSKIDPFEIPKLKVTLLRPICRECA